MNILLFEWNSITNRQVADVLTRMGHRVSIARINFKSYDGDRQLFKKFSSLLKKHKDMKFDLVFSINYFDMIADACHNDGLKYISWCYDSPVNLGDPEILKFETNYVFLFDRQEAESYQKRGYENIYYLPLAVDYKFYDSIRLTSEERKVIASDISFVGRLYSSKLPAMMEHLNDYSKAYVNAMIDAQSQIYGGNLFREVVTPGFMEFIGNPEFNKAMNTQEKLPWDTSKRKLKKPTAETPGAGKMMMEMNRLVTNRERLLLINLLSREFHFKLFTDEKNEVIKNAYNCGTADYARDMPKVFKLSKINLNISVRYIEKAIPLRCLDIMGCGGLLMTNYQEGLMEHFVEDRDLLIYHSPEDALEKARFYLDPAHDTLRKKIARSGYQKVKKYYSYEKQLDFIWEKAGVKDLL